MLRPPGQSIGVLLLVVLTRTEATSVNRVVECGDHTMEVGEVLTFKASKKDCYWNFQAPEGGKVLATCRRLHVPHSKQCSKAALDVSSQGKDKVSFCGRKGDFTINRNSDVVSFTNRNMPGRSNSFTCDVYLRMPNHVRANCTCGRENPPRARIVGGTTAGVGQYPWIGGITFRGMKRHFCAMALLSDSHGLTAAHCLHGKKRQKLIVVLAEHNIKEHGETPRTLRKIKHISYHPQHRPKRSDKGDLAVVTFDYPVPLHNRMVNPVCLPPADASDFAGREAIVAGWGSIDLSPDNYASELQAVKVPVWSNSDCRKTGFGDLIHDKLVCAGRREGGADACLGDSGGPLTVSEGGQHVLVGSVSFGHRCALPNWPGVYSRISESVAWIKDEIKRGVRCKD